MKNLFSFYNFPLTFTVGLIAFCWFCFFSVILAG